MNILVFKTVNEERFKIALKSLDTVHNEYYIIAPEDESSAYSDFDARIHYIGTKLKYIDYDMLMKEKRIPRIKFHEIWVLSSSYDRYFSFMEAYAVISELKYGKFVYKVINENKITDYNIENKIFFSGIYCLLIDIVKVCSDVLYLFERNIKGYKW